MPVFFLRYFIKQSITVFGGGKEVKMSLQILVGQRVSRCVQLKTITVPFQLNQKLSEQVFVLLNRLLLFTGNCMRIDSSLSSLKTLPSPHGLLLVRQAAGR